MTKDDIAPFFMKSRQEVRRREFTPLLTIFILAVAILILGFCLEILIQFRANYHHQLEISLVLVALAIWQGIEIFFLKAGNSSRRTFVMGYVLAFQICVLSSRTIILLLEGERWGPHQDGGGAPSTELLLVYGFFYVVHFCALTLITFGHFSASEKLAQDHLSLAKVTETRLRERERLLQELHDGFGSQLVAARVHAQREGLSQNEAVKIFNECIADLHLIVDVMKTDVISLHDALVDLRFRLDRRLQSSNLKLRGDFDVKAVPFIEQDAIIQILRIIQEAISNAIQHSRATEISLNAGYSKMELVVEIRDNGIGFGPSAHMSGNGRRNMKRRADAIGAELSFRTDHGAVVEIRLRLGLKRVSGAI